MCGIVGILGKGPVAGDLVASLKRLEYRGYDSAGIATLEGGHLARLRAEGKLANLAAKLETSPLAGHSGIGHTRWATHGAPTEANAHPHATAKVSVVHNGIIENYRELKAELQATGLALQTDTDTEVIAHLITAELAAGRGPQEAVRAVLGRLEGAFALAILFDGEDDLMICARKGSPLAIGHGEGEMFVGSDAIALSPLTRTITYLEDGDWAVLTRAGADIFDLAGGHVARPVQQSAASVFLVDKGNYRHFMAKEIHEQPEVIAHTLAHYADLATSTIRMPALPVDFATLGRLTISACGTACYAGMVAKYWFEKVARLPVDIDIASEFRYREAPLAKGGLALFISQSGETADTLAALRYCKAQGQHVASIVNVPDSTIARESDLLLPTFAGPEIGVASTKAFTCQLTALAALAIHAGRARGALSADDEHELVTALSQLPRQILEILRREDIFEAIAKDLAKARDVLYIGRGANYPIALEGALKLKEISYLHAEGLAAGELKHGSIALIDGQVPIIVVAPSDPLFDKTASNMAEAIARGGRVILIAEAARVAAHAGEIVHGIEVPAVHPFVGPIIATAPVQLLAYHTAVQMGTDVDQPRNLAKSVTVE